MIRLTSLLVAGMLGATAASQAPEFMQQYNQRLGGAIDELARIVRHFDGDARAAGLSREAAIQRFDESGDPFLNNRGRSMENTVTRWHDMSDHWRALKEANPFSRLPVFLAGIDREVVSRTWQQYKPAIPTTLEGFIYSAGGFLFTHTVFGLILSMFRRRPRPVRSRERYVDEYEDEQVRPARRRPPQGKRRGAQRYS